MGEKRVFLVHGRNLSARREVSEFLRAKGLHPIEWAQAVAATETANPYIGEILEAGFSQAQAVLVLLTGDDEARLRRELQQPDDPQYESKLTPQVRQNVLYEAGISVAKHPTRTVVCQLGEVRPFSDIFGRHLIRLNNSVKCRQELAQRLRTACPYREVDQACITGAMALITGWALGRGATVGITLTRSIAVCVDLSEQPKPVRQLV